MKFLSALVLFLGSIISLFAGSVRLFNDSPYKLRAVVRGADGSYLGEMILLPDTFNSWTDSFRQFGAFGKGNPYSEGPDRSQTPYTVFWYCLDGSDYSVCVNVSTGATITANGCDGARQCKPPKPKKVPPTGAGGEELQDQYSYDQGTEGSSDGSSTDGSE